MPAGLYRVARGGEGKIGRLLALGSHVAALDAGALADPLVAGVHHLGEIVIGDDFRRQIRAAAEHTERVSSRSGRLCLPAGGRTVGGCGLGGLPYYSGAVGGDPRDHVRLAHVDGHVDGAGETQRIGAAVAFDHHAVEAQEYAAIRGARIQLAAQRAQRPAGQQRAQRGRR